MQPARQMDRDPNVQLRALYRDLLRNQEHFEEFKHMLALYHPDNVDRDGMERPAAYALREQLNNRIREWLGTEIEHLSPGQVMQWRAIVVEDQYAVDAAWCGLAAQSNCQE